MANLEAGVNIIINQRVAGVNTPIYPFTKTSNVQNDAGENLDTILSELATADHGNHVPTVEEEVSNLRFLRNDNTWAKIQTASTTQAGVVQLSDSTSLSDSTVAATAKAVADVQAAVDALGDIDEKFIEKTAMGVASGVATLDENGLVPSSQLPSYVDDVVEVAIAEDLASATTADGETVTPEGNKIYVNIVGDNADSKTYRWSGSAFVVISETIALGETSSTAFDGARGLEAYNHANSAHAPADATVTKASDNNGYVNIDGLDTLVYTHPAVDGASETNPHGTTAADVGLSNVENKSSAEILGEIDSALITSKLGYTPQNAATLASATQSGVMSSAYAAKLDSCLPIEVTSTEPTITDGIVFQIVTE